MRDRIRYWTKHDGIATWHAVVDDKQTACGIGLDSFDGPRDEARAHLGHADEECMICKSELATTVRAGELR